MAFVRKKKVAGREYRQLVENYRENGEHRQRVLAHLGQHETVEDAIAGLRNKWSTLAAERDEHLAEQARYQAGLLDRFSAALEKHYGGEIPTYDEVVANGGYFYWLFRDEEAAYRSDFGPAQQEWLSGSGRREVYRGYGTFKNWVYRAEHHQEQAVKLRSKIDKLRSGIEKLEAVQSRGD